MNAKTSCLATSCLMSWQT